MLAVWLADPVESLRPVSGTMPYAYNVPIAAGRCIEYPARKPTGVTGNNRPGAVVWYVAVKQTLVINSSRSFCESFSQASKIPCGEYE